MNILLPLTNAAFQKSSESFAVKQELIKSIKLLAHYSIIWSGSIQTFWIQKVMQEKWTKFSKNLNYIKSSCITFCAKMFRYSLYMYLLQEESTHFFLEVFKHFGLEVSKHFINKSSCIIFFSKMFRNLQIIYCGRPIKAFLLFPSRFIIYQLYH